MQFFQGKKSGMISVELALSIACIILVLFVAIGALNNNLSTMVSNSGVQNFTKQNTAKTAYTSYGRDYTNAQVSVK